MNNEQIEQPTDVDQQAGNGQTQGTGTANGAYDAGTAEATNGQEGAVPSTMPGDMPGPLPEEAAGTDVSGDLGEVEGGMGMDAATTDAATMDAAAADAPVDLDTGHVDDTGGGAYAEASPASEQTAGADDVDVAGAGADTGAAEGPGEGATDASDASDASAEPSAEGSAAAAAAGGTDSDEMVVRTARDPRMESVGANASMEDLLRASEQQYRTLKHNDVIEGTIMRVDRDEVLVDIGAKTEGIIPSRELQSLTPEEREALAPGDPILVAVVQPENNEGHALLSLDRARQERSWRDLQRKFEAGEVIQAPVSGHNKGGLLVNIEGVRGFVPSSQISSLPPGEANKQAELSRYHNQVMSLKIIEINRNRNRLILSERQAMQEQRESMRTRLLRELEPSQIRPGTVTSIADFGAFVDIGGADGLIHLSELSWKRVSHPSDVLKVGDRINVYVLSVDPNERKIALSLKRTQPEPWSTITDNYTLGQVVRGTITQLTSFGAFARLEDGIEGLIHVSELAEGRVAHPRSVVQEGQTVELKVIRIDPVKRRIGLSLKRMFEDAAPTPGEPGASGVEGDFEAGAVASQLDDPKPGMEVGTELDPNQPSAPEARQQPLPARQAQFQREPQQRGDRDRDRDKDRDRDRDRGRRDDRGGSGGSQATVDDEPLGAMAQAFATFAQTGGLSLTAEEEQAASNRRQGRETQASTTPEPAQATVDAGTEDTQDTQGTEDTADTADTSGTSDTGTTEEVEPTTVEAALPGTTEAETTEDASTETSPMSDRMAGEPSGTEATGDSGTADVETEASMPSAASLEVGTDTDTDAGSTDVATESVATDVEEYTSGDTVDTADASVGTEAVADTDDTGTTGVETDAGSGTDDAALEADDAGTGTTSDETAESATASLNDVDAGEALSDDAATGGEEGGSDEIEAGTDTDTDTDSDTSDSGAVSGAEAMPTVADASPVDGEEGGSDEFNG